MKVFFRIGLVIALLPLLLPMGCGSKNPINPIPLSQRDWFIHEPCEPIQGKLTYQGQPVPAGLLFFYNNKSYTPGALLPVGNAVIKDGSYRGQAPAGVVIVCVITDTEALKDGGPPRVAAFMHRHDPRSLAGISNGLPGPGGARPKLRPGSSKASVLAEAMKNKDLPLGEDGKPISPPGEDGQPVQQKTPNERKERMMGATRKDPFEGLSFSAEEKTMLKEIQEKYGIITDPLFTITVGKGEQTLDIDLK